MGGKLRRAAEDLAPGTVSGAACAGDRRNRVPDGAPGGKERGNFINHQLPLKNGV